MNGKGVRGKLARANEGGIPGIPGDIGDQATINLDIAVTLGIEQSRLQLRPSGGQTRNEAGEVVCRDCGEPIPEKRLRALPGVVDCLRCHEQNHPAKMPGRRISSRQTSTASTYRAL